jgi:uncharacterized protein (DUF2252 family)
MGARRFSRQEAEDFGRNRRKHVSRSSLGKFDARARRTDPLAVIAEAAQGRVPELLPIKFNLMAASLFAFYRGTAEIMAADLAAAKHTGIEVQLCGDAHIRNFGFFATPDAQVIFDVNDFDETFRGPWEWDVKRLITSIVLAGRESGETKAGCRTAVESFLEEYCGWIHRFSRMSTLDVARHRAHRDMAQPGLRAALAKAERASPAENLAKLARKTRAGWQFLHLPKRLWDVKGAEKRAVLGALPAYRETLSPDHRMIFDRFRALDVGFKVVGTGSIGTRDYVVLMFGRDENDVLILQVKEEHPSIYARYLQGAAPANQGQRVVEGQRALQVQSDFLLGWCSIAGRDYLVRQLNDHKSSLEVAGLSGKPLLEYGRLCAELLAKGHARSGEPVAISAYLGPSRKAADSLMQFAFEYAAQVQADFNAFRKAWRSGALRHLLHHKHGTT